MGDFDKCFKKIIAFSPPNGVFNNRYNAFSHVKGIFILIDDTFYLNEFYFSFMFLYIIKIIILSLVNNCFNKSLK
jgi:hypothetical protein